MSDTQRYIVIVDDRLFKSITRDVITFAMVISLVLLGKFANSPALEWVGGFFAILAVFAKATTDKRKYKTVREAQQYLDELEEQRDGE